MLKSTLGLSLIALFFIFGVQSATSFSEDINLIATAERRFKREVTEEPVTEKKGDGKPQLTTMHINSNITNRFAHTVISSRYANPSQNAQEATFSVVLPEQAFISGFVMEIGNKSYHAYVKEKAEAKKEYEHAVQSGFSAGHVAVSARDSNRFTVSVNVEPLSKVTFNLSYEQLLVRKDGLYDMVINLHPGQPVKDMRVEVKIAESRPILNLKTPSLRSGNEIGDDSEERDPRSEITKINDTHADVKFHPTIEKQKQYAKSFGKNEEDGLSGQFVVQYDVERDPHGGEVLLNDGYFVHFFAPADLKPLKKHVVFVLDISGSMWDRKMVQLKEAMDRILSDLHPGDLFNLVQFESIVQVWDLENPGASITFPKTEDSWYIGDHNQSATDFNFPRAYPANEGNIKKAKKIVSGFSATGGTNIFDALQVALHLIEVENTSTQLQPIIMFLTDGDPTVGITNTQKIVTKIVGLNDRAKSAGIFTLSFGDGADKEFLKKLALSNSGFSRHIYEGADAQLQLQDFYRQISSPLLSKVHFKYTPTVETTSLTKIDFPILFNGTELVVCGKYDADVETAEVKPTVNAWGINGPINLIPKRAYVYTNLERLWAYLTIQQLLDKKETAENKTEIEKKALDIALKYSFVTPVSSLVVVKPNVTTAVQTEEAKAEGNLNGPVAPLLKSRTLMSPHNSGKYHFYKKTNPSRLTINKAGNVNPSQRYYLSAALPIAAVVPLAGFAGPPAAPLGAPLDVVPAGGALGMMNRPTYHLQSMQFGISAPSFPPQPIASLPESADFDSDIDVRPTFATTTVIYTSTTTTKANLDETKKLNWLSGIKNTQNDTISLPTGIYRLGTHSTTTSKIICDLPETTSRTTKMTGVCTLIKDCPTIYNELTDVTVYMKYFCQIEGFAGVCCHPPASP